MWQLFCYLNLTELKKMNNVRTTKALICASQDVNFARSCIRMLILQDFVRFYLDLLGLTSRNLPSLN